MLDFVWVQKQSSKQLEKNNLIQPSGYASINIAKENGMWNFLDDVENLIIPNDLQLAFDNNPIAFKNYESFARGYRKSYLYWLKQAKREETRQKRITQIIEYCFNNKKTR